VRIVAATNKNLEQEVTKRTFREDLFYRLNVVRVQLPPLRQRLEDVRLLAEYFLHKVALQKRLPQPKLSEEAVRVLEAYGWPGNVRELENTIQRACVLATSSILLAKDIPLGLVLTDDAAPAEPATATAASPMTTASAIELLLNTATADPDVQLLPWLEREFTLHALKVTHGNQVRAAKLLGITRATLRKRIERFAITKELTIS
jgi:two-component system nitrogen regulation response regulator GlnG